MIVVAVLDGVAVDEGVAFELGYAYAKGKFCVGFSTDSRRGAGYFKNPMCEGSIVDTFCHESSLIQRLKQFARA